MSFQLDQHSNYGRLLRDLGRRGLVLFVGAGINGKKELLWSGLLGRLCAAALERVFDEERATPAERSQVLGSLDGTSGGQLFNVYQKASLIKQLLGKRYIPVLQKAIYPNSLRDLESAFSSEDSQELATLLGVARLCCSRRARVHAVVTFNCDNYLCMAIDQWNRSHRDDQVVPLIAFHQDVDSRSRAGGRVLPIYHVHGYIPPPWEIRRRQGGAVVLSYDEYFQNMLEPSSWQTTTQLHFLMNYTCLFIGASLTDMNMLRTLAAAKKYGDVRNSKPGRSPTGRYALVISGDASNDSRGEASRIGDRLRATVLCDAGVNPIFVTKEKLPQILDKLAGGGGNGAQVSA
ncbi:MAG: SIR2 family protein [Polyangiaceae bacterium]|nr:SIR2 family protein [Polyangiaceae bacterium]